MHQLMPNLAPNAIEVTGWIIQTVLLFLVFRAQTGKSKPSQPIPLTTVFLVFLLAWNWRLIYEFALASSGFWCFVHDDMARWELSWSWAQKPFLITWDGVWQGATFYLHGTAMRWIHDPMMASKFVSAICNLVPLAGVFFFTDGLYRDRRYSLAVVLFVAPFWLHLLLGTGAMAEMPVVGLMLGGAGLFLKATDPSTRHRRTLIMAAALAFAGATAFHVTAWMMLVPVLIVSLGYVLKRSRQQGDLTATTWLLFALISTSYCVVWLTGCWIKFGNPIQFLNVYSHVVIRDGGVLPLPSRIWAYPKAILYTTWSISPLIAFGIGWGLTKRSEELERVRWVIITAASALAILIISAIRASPNPHSYRTTVTLATLLIPVALSPLRGLVHDFRILEVPSLRRLQTLATVATLLFVCLWIVDNHRKTIRRQRELNSIDANAVAVGTWLRQEIIQPQLLALSPASPPIRIWTPDAPNFQALVINYSCGHPDRLRVWNDSLGPGIESMTPGQYLLTTRQVDSSRLSQELEFGRYKIYRLLKPR